MVEEIKSVYVKGKLIVNVSSKGKAEAIAAAVEPENRLMTNFKISTYSKDNNVVTEFENIITLRSLKATLDDLLEAIILSENISSKIVFSQDTSDNF